jgi:glycosyltransferase involved in cell wall biosynthesis
MNLHIITRCTRVENLPKVKNSLPFDAYWHIIFDTSTVQNLETSFLEEYSENFLYFWRSFPGDMAHQLINRVIEEIPGEDWIYILDDDNEMHPELISTLESQLESFPEAEGFIFSQYVGGKDFTKLEIREARPENVKVQGIDMAQFLLKRSLIGEKRFVPGTYVSDGIFIEELYRENKEKFIFVDKVLCNYNSLQKEKLNYTLPRVLSLGTDAELKSSKLASYESDELAVIRADNHTALQEIIDKDPDAILTIGDYTKYSSLLNLPPDFRLRWINLATHEKAGEVAYLCGMNYILSSSINQDLISVFTPIYNTGEKLIRTYTSMIEQTYVNWEWVLVDDSTDSETTRIAEQLASVDPRVKVFNFKQKTQGIIGEAKYRACSMTRGKYLVELDHDDVLLPHALEKTLKAFQDFPDAGFVYSDCAEIDESHRSLMYGENFAFGYGSYRNETHRGVLYKVADTPNINPVTIRHIVSVPNHLRAWRRDVYFEIGGHNRRLSIADDYELIVRTFLKTRFVKIPLCCYLQFHHGGNSQNSARGDIQRRVRTISIFYNDRIKERFEELGKEDWAHGKNFKSLEKRNSETEGFVNYTLQSSENESLH